MSRDIYRHIYICVYVCVYIYIYIYIYMFKDMCHRVITDALIRVGGSCSAAAW